MQYLDKVFVLKTRNTNSNGKQQRRSIRFFAYIIPYTPGISNIMSLITYTITKQNHSHHPPHPILITRLIDDKFYETNDKFHDADDKFYDTDDKLVETK